MRISLVALALLCACSQSEGPAPGLRAPEIVALDLEHKPVRLSDYRGQVVVLDFWTGGCGPCLVDMAQMNSLYLQYRDDGLTVLAVNQGEPREDVVEHIRRGLSVSFPIAIDQRGVSTRRYQVMAVPTSFILDREGIVREKVLGEISRSRLEAMLTPLLGVDARPQYASPAARNGRSSSTPSQSGPDAAE